MDRCVRRQANSWSHQAALQVCWSQAAVRTLRIYHCGRVQAARNPFICRLTFSRTCDKFCDSHCSSTCSRREISVLVKWYSVGRKGSRRKRGVRKATDDPGQVHGTRSAMTQSVSDYFDRLQKPLKVEGLWAWRDIAVAIHHAQIKLQSGTVCVERAWQSVKDMLPPSGRHMSRPWLEMLLRIAFLGHNFRLYKSGSNPAVSEGDSLITESLQFYEQCEQSIGFQGLDELFAAFEEKVDDAYDN